MDYEKAVKTASKSLKEAMTMLRKAACKLNEAAEGIRAIPESYRIDALTSETDHVASDVRGLMQRLGVEE